MSRHNSTGPDPVPEQSRLEVADAFLLDLGRKLERLAAQAAENGPTEERDLLRDIQFRELEGMLAGARVVQIKLNNIVNLGGDAEKEFLEQWREDWLGKLQSFEPGQPFCAYEAYNWDKVIEPTIEKLGRTHLVEGQTNGPAATAEDRAERWSIHWMKNYVLPKLEKTYVIRCNLLKERLDRIVSQRYRPVGDGSDQALDAVRDWADKLMKIVEREENRGRVEDFVEFYVLYRRVYKFLINRRNPASLAFAGQWFL
ncbi:hypothetical protein JCM3766R1_003279 [Sporobolomyces carnicolor]